MIAGGLQPGCEIGQGLQDQLGKDGFLARKVEVDGALADLGALCNRIHRRPAKAMLGKDDPALRQGCPAGDASAPARDGR